MIKVGLPTALIYDKNRMLGSSKIQSNLYHEEGLHEYVNIHVYNDDTEFEAHFAKWRPDLIITVDGTRGDWKGVASFIDHIYISTKWIHYSQQYDDVTMANDIARESTNWACAAYNKVFDNPDYPYFSVFTGAYKTEDRLYRAYEGMKNQTYKNWEWVVIDDSTADHTRTWEILQELANKDYRVRPHRITHPTGGNIGEVKNRAASLSNGSWLIEMDHDDYLLPTLMQESVGAIKQFPDAGFLYTDVAEPYEDGEMRMYTKTIGPRETWYANPQNTFVWGFGGHEWVNWNGTDYVCHRYPEINPKTIRFNIGMPNHARIWKQEVYNKIGKHNRNISVADDYELIVRTFLNTRMVHIRKMLYLQYNNRNSTVDNNAYDINRKARLIKDYYDSAIHARIQELGHKDWEWVPEVGRANLFQFDCDRLKYFENESVLNYIYE